jgi:hypothetical protein
MNCQSALPAVGRMGDCFRLDARRSRGANVSFACSTQRVADCGVVGSHRYLGITVHGNHTSSHGSQYARYTLCAIRKRRCNPCLPSTYTGVTGCGSYPIMFPATSLVLCKISKILDKLQENKWISRMTSEEDIRSRNGGVRERKA